MFSRRVAAVGAALMLAALVPACGSSSGSKSANDTGSATTAKTASIDPSRDLRQVVVAPPPTSWDPAETKTQFNQLPRYYFTVYDTLVHFNANDKLEPQLATKWSYDATNTVLTLTLRSDVTFTDGSKFDATVAKNNLERMQKGTSQGAGLIAGIKSIEATSPTQLTITQTAPNAKVLLALGTPAAAMVSPLALQNPASLAQHPVGSGPFRLESQTATSATFARNDNYWNKSVTFAAHQTFIATADINARINALLTGVADFAQIANQAPTPDFVAKVNAGEFQMVTLHGVPSVLGMNTKIPPLDNPKVVQAINYALDRDQINQVVYNGQCKPTSQIFSPGTPGYVEGLNYTYDLKKAQQLMDESGVGKVHIKFQSVAGVNTPAPDLYASMLAKIGITLDIQATPPALLTANYAAGKFAMSGFQLFPAAPDPIFTMDYITGPLNPGTKDPQLVSLVNKANALSVNDPGRNKAYQDVSRYVFDHPIGAPICQVPNTLAGTKNVVGIDKIPMAVIGNMDTVRLGLKAKG